MVERCERRWLWGFALLVMVLTTLPYLTGYARQDDAWRYTGLLFAAEDVNSYIAKMFTGAQGAWLFRTPYTGYTQRGVFLFFPYLLLGKLAAPPDVHVQLTALFQIYRFTGGLLSMFATYHFLAVFLTDIRMRRLGTALAVLGGGLGWLSVIGLSGLWKDSVPLEYYSPETFGFLSIYGLPHLAWARSLFLWGLRDYLLAAPDLRSGRSWLRTGFIWLGLGLVQPMTVVVGWFVLAAHLAFTGAAQLFLVRKGLPADWVKWRGYFSRAAQIGLVSAPLALYTFLSFKIDPYLRVWESQSYILSPPVLHYLLAYGAVLPLAWMGIRSLLRQNVWTGWLVAGWVLIFPLLAYAPFSSQRRLLEGVWVGLVVLSVTWLSGRHGRARRLAYGWFSLSFLTTLFLYLGGLMAVWSRSPVLFLPAGEVHAFEYLAEHAARGELVLASYGTSNSLPAWAPVRTVTGHGPESMDGPAVNEQIACFYSTACTDDQRAQFLEASGVAYVFWGPREQALGDWDPRQAPFLDLAYTHENYFIFQFIPSS